MYKLCFFVPINHVESVKQAVFAAGAGTIGQYDCCSWQTLGQGQFRPLDGSQPFVGQMGELEQVEEYRVEMVMEKSVATQVITALKNAHPYETPAYDVTEVIDID